MTGSLVIQIKHKTKNRLAGGFIRLGDRRPKLDRLQKAYCVTGLQTVSPASVVARSYPPGQLGVPALS